ncbi:MAG TPA: ATP-dependent sacrificial sulfur transferase LarE [Candidatus Dormibacteraeota bacterium]|nr:ATP-dependent sacrificial sulfur transferase LarE [Candidatus Dormibacteraeota bacterium]
MSEDPSRLLLEKMDRAVSIIRKYDGAVVALSAGVDSSLVAFMARRALGERAVAVTGESESLPPEELQIARETGNTIGVRHIVVRTNELENPNYASNPENRCYFCKETLYTELRKIADSLGFEAILDGTHVDDLGEHRPGLKAGQEAGVISPLLLASFSKADVRQAARALGLSVWDKPAMPCLSSRIAHGEGVTEEKLAMIGHSELYIRQLTGVRNLRVRYSNGLARVEVSPEERKAFFDEKVMNLIDSELKRLGFTNVTLDMGGYVKKETRMQKDPLSLPMAT